MIHCPAEEENLQVSLGFAAPLGTSPGQLLLRECDSPLPTACPSLVLFCLVVVFSFQAKGRSSPSIAWCPRNTPSFPDLPLVLVPDFHLLSPALSISRPTAFTQWHTHANTVLMGDLAASPCSNLQAATHQHLLQTQFCQCPRRYFSTKQRLTISRSKDVLRITCLPHRAATD